jgi:hypothetical protein
MLKHLSVLLCTTTTALVVFGACSSDSDGPVTAGDSGVNTANGDGDGVGNGDGDGDDDGGSQGVAGSGNGGNGGDDASAGSDPGTSDDGGADPGAGGPVAAIPLSDADFDTSMLDDEEALQKLVGEYEIAIYLAPEDLRSDIGPGTIDVAYDGDIVHLTLKDADGATIAEVQNSRENPVDYGQAAFTQVLGKILVDDRSSMHQRIDVTLSPDGSIFGYVGGAGEFYQFRNNIIHYGPTPPQHLLSQVGTWVGPQLAGTCERPPITLEVAADASVTLSGTANLDCQPGEIQNRWDGQDDFVVARAGTGTVQIVIDSTHGGGSQATGGVWLTVNEDPDVVGVLGAKAVLEGFRGNLESESLELQ